MTLLDRSLVRGPLFPPGVPVHLADRGPALRFQLLWAAVLALALGALGSVGDWLGAFRSPAAVGLILAHAVPLLLVGLAAAAVVAQGGFDFAGPQVAPLAAALAALGHPVLALLAALGVGLVNGALVSGLRVPGYLLTLLTAAVVRALAVLCSGGGPVSRLAEPLDWALTAAPWVVPAAAVFAFLGWQLAPAGAPAAGRLRQRLAEALPYAASALLAGYAGVYTAARIGGASPAMGVVDPLEIMAVVILGGCWIGSGRANVAGAVLVALGLTTLRYLANVTDVPPLLMLLAVAALALLGLLVSIAAHLLAARRLARTRAAPAAAPEAPVAVAG